MSSFAISSCYGRKCVSTSSIPSLLVSCTGQLIHTLLVSHQCAPEAIHFHLPPHWYTPRTSSTAPGHPLPITIPGDSRSSSSIRLCSTWSAAAHVLSSGDSSSCNETNQKGSRLWSEFEMTQDDAKTYFDCLLEAELTRGARWLNH